MKKITRKRICNLIEGLCLVYENTSKTHKEAERIITDMYKYAHIGKGSCKNPHKDWQKDFIELEKSLVDWGIINYV